eukprot:9171920-Pyramimonas_sp.AAC.1
MILELSLFCPMLLNSSLFLPIFKNKSSSNSRACLTFRSAVLQKRPGAISHDGEALPSRA